MPFSKCIINTDFPKKEETDSSNKNLDVDLSANKRMINVIRHLSQLARAADDIFGGIELECKHLIQRTADLTAKIQNCQKIVDKLDPKTVKIPLPALKKTREAKTSSKSCNDKDIGPNPIFSTFPRPPEVERLRRLANGPSPPVHIPSDKVVLETDGDPGTSSALEATHIYCKPIQVAELNNYKTSLPAENHEKANKTMSASVKMPSSVVPIDISGQSFSRMANFRRSLIHVEFFIKRKKKDKRRNSVAEGDTKELKNALQNIINEDKKFISNGTLSKNLISNGVCKSGNDLIKKDTIQETNNNFPKDITVVIDSNEKETLKRDYCEEPDKAQILQNGNAKLEQKSNYNSDVAKSYINKRKPKSHLPISTVSAAMNVAVEMRQRNGIEDHSSSNYSSDHNSSDSENRKTVDKEKEQDPPTTNGEDSGFSDNFKNRSKDNGKILSPKISTKNDGTEAFSSASSENNTMQDDESSNATSMESDAFLMSSDESDEDSPELMVQKYGSSTSVSTMSDGSLNSLLSQNGTGMASSTGTLTSIGQERFPTPPPPPPPFVMVAPKKEVRDNVLQFTASSYKTDIKPLSSKPSPPHEIPSRTNKISVSPKKSSKPDQRKSSIDSNKGIFATLVNKKSRAKEQRKSGSLCTKSTMTQPCFDMYGNNSPQKMSRSSIFVKENTQPLSGTEPASFLQSFLPKNNQNIDGERNNKNKQIDNYYVKKETTSTESSPASVFNNNTNILGKNDAEIPQKYAHHVVVTPISRQDENRKHLCRKSLFVNNNDTSHESDNEKTYCHSQNNGRNLENTTYNLQKPQRPQTLHTGPKPSARVVLDPNGKVIYSTNSLDRRLPYGYPLTARNMNEYCNSSQSPINMSKTSNSSIPQQITSPPKHSNFQNGTNDFPSYCDKNTRKVSNFSTFASNAHLRSNDNSHLSATPINKSSQNQQIYFRSNYSDTDSQVYTNDSKINSSNSSESSSRSKRPPPSYEEAVGRHCPHIIIADPNVSGLPEAKPMLTQENINLHLENIERLNKMHLGCRADSSQSLISPPTNMSSPLESNLRKLQKSTMSTEDLFAVIHDCKKRMNIKTDSDISLASSSSSSSPSYLRSNQTKGTLVETGFLSPRTFSNFSDCRDRRSWADFRPASSSPTGRKSLASDRLGRTKPTSMHDFKMLLLQARGNNQTSGPRKSAVEMLKISQSPKSPNGEGLPSYNSHHSQSFSAQSSPTSPSYIHNGHSTVPFKRHNNRIRSSLQSRYTMYPPIFEDCLEEAEIKNENATKSFS